MLNSFTVEAYRSFAKPTKIELRPITLLLGRNSSGKSSLTRLIPLLQQSLDRRTASPILWNSDDVDFGDISNVLNSTSPDGELKISLEIDASRYPSYVVQRSPYMWTPLFHPGAPNTFLFTAVLTNDGGRTKYKSTVIEIEDQKLEIFWGNQSVDHIKLNGKIISDYYQPSEIFATTSSLFPTVGLRSLNRARNAHADISAFSVYGAGLLYPAAQTALDYFINKKTGQSKRVQLRRSLMYVPPSKMEAYVSNFDHRVKSKIKHKSQLRTLSDALLISEFPNILGFMDSVVRPTLETAAYLGPARASGARFYRYQELSVERIDPRGENLPMYLSSLNKTEMDGFNELMLSACGNMVDVKQAGGHASIFVGRDSDNMENLADVGFGFSQFLPIIAQIHAATQRPASRIPTSAPSDMFIMAVEQPELHLHPAFQAALADMLVSAVKPNTKAVKKRRFLIETHSEALIGRLAELVSRGDIAPDDVIIYFVEKSEESRNSSVRIGGFDSDGNVTNWPMGFFSGTD